MSAITKALYEFKKYTYKIAEKSILLSEQKVAIHSCALLFSSGIFAPTIYWYKKSLHPGKSGSGRLQPV